MYQHRHKTSNIRAAMPPYADKNDDGVVDRRKCYLPVLISVLDKERYLIDMFGATIKASFDSTYD